MEKQRFVLFIVLAIVTVFGWQMLLKKFFPPKPRPVAQQVDAEGKKADDAKPAADGVKPEPAQGADVKVADVKPAEGEAPAEPAVAVPEVVLAEKWVTLGSIDPDSPYRMLVTLTNRGAAVQRIELNGDRYRDIDDRSGYLGNFAAADAPNGAGLLVQVVGPGTPAAAAGLEPGDIITSVQIGDGNQLTVENTADLNAALAKSKAKDVAKLGILRAGKPITVEATLRRRPVEVIRPEKNHEPVVAVEPGNHDPLSLLLRLNQIGPDKLSDDIQELKGAALASANWEITKNTPDLAEFRRTLPDRSLEVIKRYRLAKRSDNDPPPAAEQDVDKDAAAQPHGPGYHVMVDIEIVNRGQDAREIAYRLDGPNGLPVEGAWYAARIHRRSGDGLRDVVARIDGVPDAFSASMVATPENLPLKQWRDMKFDYVGVASQYFAVCLLPQSEAKNYGLVEFKPVLVGDAPEQAAKKKFANVSFRLTSQRVNLAPDAKLAHSYQMFVGPKQKALLEQYVAGGAPLTDLIYHGWPIWDGVASLMSGVLHFFYSIVHNYGLAIIMLTVLVRGAMHPLSRKQARSAQKMQELKPEMDRINAKYKGKPEERGRAMQELFRKHNYNPLGGCLLLFLQLPIFMGLYRALMIDVELRQAPLISDSIRWCSNLGAPDMLWRWDAYLPAFLAAPDGWLGPYLNILPLMTVGLFIWQQKMFMPPATDDQTRMQQKIMQYMMIFIGVMFFKVASGLCIYFIASSLWGIAERKMLPKAATPGVGSLTNLEERGSTAEAPLNREAAEAARQKRKRRQKGKN